MLEERAHAAEGRDAGSNLPDVPSLPWTPRDTLLAGLEVVLVVLLYAQSLRFDFVLDDLPLILKNPFVLISWRAIPQFFAEGLFGRLYPDVPNNMYRPMFSVWLVFNHALWGFNPAGWHLVAVLLLALNTLGVYALGRRVLQDRPLAALAAMIFALHPIHVESTAWIIGTNEALMVMLFVASLLAYFRSRDATRLRKLWLGVSLGCFALALLVKEEAIVLPVLVASYVWVFGRRSESSPVGPARARLGEALLCSIPFWAVAAAYFAVRFEVLHGLSHTATNVPFSVMVRTIPLILWYDIRSLLWPSGLCIFYESPFVEVASVSNFLLPLAVVLTVGASLLAWGRRSSSAAFAAIWSVVPVLPFLDLPLLPDGEFMHDRWLYLPSVGFVLLVGVAVRAAARHLRPRLRPIVFELVIAIFLGLACGALTVRDSRFWANEQVLFAHVTVNSPGSNFALDGLAYQYAQRGQCDVAASIYHKVLARSPRYWLAFLNMGVCHTKVGAYEAALRDLARAAQIAPVEPVVYYWIGRAQYGLGHFGVAEASLRRAVEFRPDGAGYHLALGMVLDAEGDTRQALAEFRLELAYHPGEAAALRKIDELQSRTRPATGSAPPP